mgnify:CR=1 FL=1
MAEENEITEPSKERSMRKVAHTAFFRRFSYQYAQSSADVLVWDKY